MHYEKKIAVSKMEVHSIALVQRQSMQNFSLKISFCLYIKEENFLNLLCNITMTPTNMSVYRKVIQMLLCNITMTPTNMSGYRKVIQMLLCNITMTPTNMSVYRKVIQMLLCNITMTPTNMSGYRKVIQM
jgi:dUTPase